MYSLPAIPAFPKRNPRRRRLPFRPAAWPRSAGSASLRPTALPPSPVPTRDPSECAADCVPAGSPIREKARMAGRAEETNMGGNGCGCRCGRIRSGSNRGRFQRRAVAGRPPGHARAHGQHPAGRFMAKAPLQLTAYRPWRLRRMNGDRCRRAPRHPPAPALRQGQAGGIFCWERRNSLGAINSATSMSRTHCKITIDAQFPPV